MHARTAFTRYRYPVHVFSISGDVCTSLLCACVSSFLFFYFRLAWWRHEPLSWISLLVSAYNYRSRWLLADITVNFFLSILFHSVGWSVCLYPGIGVKPISYYSGGTTLWSVVLSLCECWERTRRSLVLSATRTAADKIQSNTLASSYSINS